MEMLRSQVLRSKRAVTSAIFALALLLFVILQCNRTANNPPPPLPIANSLQEIHDSKIVFNPSREMEQGKPERVEARISYEDIGDAIMKDLKGRGEPELKTIQVGQQMTVTLLADEKEFDIKKYGPDEQLVAGRPFAQWEWEVTPLQYGELTLHLKAVINLSAAGTREGAYGIPVIDRPIKVKVNPPYIAAQAARNREIWSLVIGGGSLLGVITGILAWWRKRGRNKQRQWETP